MDAGGEQYSRFGENGNGLFSDAQPACLHFRSDLQLAAQNIKIMT